MITLDHVLLLEQKVESAVKKISQLQAENDALRSRCAELTNALSSKSEQLSAFEQDQGKIESGILKALDRLSAIENSVLQTVGQIQNSSVDNNAQVAPSFEQQNNMEQNTQQTNEIFVPENQTFNQNQEQQNNYFEQQSPSSDLFQQNEQYNSDNGQFDIF
ncbi:MAG: cell division protein ZapB [Treponema sp.]|jgi:FtsZ-binding cell division protein ZapB|nr:cell division protein ZapB [Treponema sp.]MBQ5645483.1 cell division protein ZapB [Treponema sp.]MBQ5877879.1 cell division protein ZapB [Treponema sp.]MEE1057798.1 cell division protein ZapB [Treponema sp.]